MKNDINTFWVLVGVCLFGITVPLSLYSYVYEDLPRFATILWFGGLVVITDRRLRSRQKSVDI